MDSYGVWDLIYRYLLPGWWIIPVYVTVTAWIATISWWRRAIRLGMAWAQRAPVVLDDAPTAGRYAIRVALALPFFVVPTVVLALWYLFGCTLWSSFHSDDNRVILAPSLYSVAAVGYALIGIVVAVWSMYDYDDFESLVRIAFLFSLLPAVPLILFGLLFLVPGLLFALMDLIADVPTYSRQMKLAGGFLLAAVTPFVGFCVAGWTARLGVEIIAGAAADQPSPATRR